MQFSVPFYTSLRTSDRGAPRSELEINDCRWQSHLNSVTGVAIPIDARDSHASVRTGSERRGDGNCSINYNFPSGLLCDGELHGKPPARPEYFQADAVAGLGFQQQAVQLAAMGQALAVGAEQDIAG